MQMTGRAAICAVLLLQMPIALYEQSGLLYAIFSKLNTTTFESIRNV